MSHEVRFLYLTDFEGKKIRIFDRLNNFSAALIIIGTPINERELEIISSQFSKRPLGRDARANRLFSTAEFKNNRYAREII